MKQPTRVFPMAARVLFLLGASLLAIGVVNHAFSLRILELVPELPRDIGFLYVYLWTLIVPTVALYKGVTSRRSWLRRTSRGLGLFILFFVAIMDYRSYALHRQVAAVLESGVPTEFGMSPTHDVILTEDAFFCGPDDSHRVLSWADRWGGTNQLVCVDATGAATNHVEMFIDGGLRSKARNLLHGFAICLAFAGVVLGVRYSVKRTAGAERAF